MCRMKQRVFGVNSQGAETTLVISIPDIVERTTRLKNSSGTVKATITPDQIPGLAGNADDIATLKISRWLMCCAVVAEDHIVLPPAIRIFRPAPDRAG